MPIEEIETDIARYDMEPHAAVEAPAPEPVTEITVPEPIPVFKPKKWFEQAKLHVQTPDDILKLLLIAIPVAFFIYVWLVILGLLLEAAKEVPRMFFWMICRVLCTAPDGG